LVLVSFIGATNRKIKPIIHGTYGFRAEVTASDEPSSWAAEAVQEAMDLGMVSGQLQSNWQKELARGEFAELAVSFLVAQYGYDGENEVYLLDLQTGALEKL
jgi:hypothetical protein